MLLGLQPLEGVRLGLLSLGLPLRWSLGAIDEALWSHAVLLRWVVHASSISFLRLSREAVLGWRFVKATWHLGLTNSVRARRGRSQVNVGALRLGEVVRAVDVVLTRANTLLDWFLALLTDSEAGSVVTTLVIRIIAVGLVCVSGEIIATFWRICEININGSVFSYSVGILGVVSARSHTISRLLWALLAYSEGLGVREEVLAIVILTGGHAVVSILSKRLRTARR